MAAISRAQLLRELLPGLNVLFGNSYKRYDNEYQAIYTESSSVRSFEEDVKLSGFMAAPVKQEGAATVFDTAQEVFTVRYIHETISMGFALTQEAVEDNLYDSLSTRYVTELAHSMHETKEIKAAAVLNNGFTTYLSGDGVSLYNTAHPQVSAPAIANRPTVAVDFSETAVENALTQISAWTDDRGKRINAQVRKLVVPYAGVWAASRVLKSELQTGTANNDINAVKNLMAIPDGYVVNHYLTDPDAWFLLTNVPNGFRYFNRVAMSTSSDGDFDTGNLRWKARERYSFGNSDYLSTWGSPGA